MLFKKIIMVTVMALCIGFGFFVPKMLRFTPFSRSAEINIKSTVKEILPIAEFSSLAYHYSAVMTHSDVIKFFNTDIPVPLTEKKVIYTIDGAIKLGFNGNDIRIDNQGYNIIIYMPEIKILSHEIFPETFSLYDEKSSIFNRYTLTIANELQMLQKSEQEDKVNNNHELFIQAQQSAEQLFKSLLGCIPDIRDKYTIVFQWS